MDVLRERILGRLAPAIKSIISPLPIDEHL